MTFFGKDKVMKIKNITKQLSEEWKMSSKDVRYGGGDYDIFVNPSPKEMIEVAEKGKGEESFMFSSSWEGKNKGRVLRFLTYKRNVYVFKASILHSSVAGALGISVIGDKAKTSVSSPTYFEGVAVFSERVKKWVMLENHLIEKSFESIKDSKTEQYIKRTIKKFDIYLNRDWSFIERYINVSIYLKKAKARLEKLKIKYLKEAMEDDASKFAEKAHKGQVRRFTGNKYFTHPKQVAELVKKYKSSHKIDELVSAALLHDTIEDTGTTGADLEKMFGGLVASLVQELTNDEKELKRLGKTEYMKQKMRNMSSWGLVIKLADRLSNVSDFDTADPKFVNRYRKQTDDIVDSLERHRILTDTHKRLIAAIRKKMNERRD